MKLEADVDSQTYWKREPNLDDRWDGGEEGLEIYGAKLRRLPDDAAYGWELGVEPGDAVVVLVEHYENGGTFGSCEYAEVKGIFKDRKSAEEAASSIPTGHGYFGRHIDFIYFDEIVPKERK